MKSKRTIVATYKDAADAANAMAELETAEIPSSAMSMMRPQPVTHALGFTKLAGHSAAGLFVFPECAPLLIKGPLASAMGDLEESSDPSKFEGTALLTGLAMLGIPKGSLEEHAETARAGQSLIIVRGTEEEILRIREVLQKSCAVNIQLHLPDRVGKPNLPFPVTRVIMQQNRHILFPVDFSQRSKDTFAYVGAVARKFNSELTLLHVLGPFEGLPSEPEMTSVDWPHYQTKLLEKRQSELMAMAGATLDGIKVTAVADSGDPTQKIMHYAAEHDVGLIIMPTHGRGTFRKLLLGSITSQLLHDSAYPIWTTAHAETWAGHAPQDVRRIVCALDPASDGIALLHATADIASVYDAEVTIVHAVPVHTASLEAGMDSGFDRFLADAASASIAELQASSGNNWKVVIDNGNVAAVVSEFVRRTRADLVVIGRGCISESLGALRTHVGAIIRESPCPVLSVSSAR